VLCTYIVWDFSLFGASERLFVVLLVLVSYNAFKHKNVLFNKFC